MVVSWKPPPAKISHVSFFDLPPRADAEVVALPSAGALYGAVRCFKFLLIISDGNLEIVHLCDHRNDITGWLLQHFHVG
jgi:hypothetical protein